MLYNLVKIVNINQFLKKHYGLSFDGAWLYIKSPMAVPEQGWKIHISVTEVNFASTISDITSVLLANHCWFKVPITEHALLMLLSGAVNYLETGKIITIYLPQPSPENVVKVIQQLAAVLPITKHATIPTDVEFGETNIYLRYGTYYPHYQTDDYGRTYLTLRDQNHHIVPGTFSFGHSRPSWVSPLPLVQNSADKVNDPLGQVPLAQLGIHHPQVIRRSAKDTVFLIRYHDIPAILKVGKANQLIDGKTSSVDRLAGESLILHKIAGKVRAPSVLFTLKTDQQYILVEKKIQGKSLLELITHVRLGSNRIKRIYSIALSLLRQLTILHGLGIVYGDLSPSNIFINRDDRVTLIDFDTASFVSDHQPFKGGTPGFFSYDKVVEFGCRPISDDTYAFGAMLYYMATSFLALYSEELSAEKMPKFYEKMELIVKTTATNSLQYRIGMLGLWLMAHKNVSYSEIQKRLELLHSSSQDSTNRRDGNQIVKLCFQTSLAAKFINNRIAKMDFCQKQALSRAGVFRRRTSYLSLNEGIIGLLLVIREYTNKTKDTHFVSDVQRILGWIKKSYATLTGVHPGLINGDILLIRIIAWYTDLTNDQQYVEYAHKVAKFAIHHSFSDPNMAFSMTNGSVGIASVLLQEPTMNQASRKYCNTVAVQCIARVLNPQHSDNCRRLADASRPNGGLVGMGVFLVLYTNRFPSMKGNKAIDQIASELDSLLDANQRSSQCINVDELKKVALFFIVYGRFNKRYAKTGEKLLGLIDQQCMYEFTNVRSGVAGLLTLAQLTGNRYLIRKYQQILLMSASSRDNVLVWPLPWQVYLTNDYFLDGNNGVYWALLRSIPN